MSLRPEELQNHCQTILCDANITNRIIILCEGVIKPFIEARSAHFYRRMQDFPDANFYRACIPEWWNIKQPRFFTCGDRKDVIDTYFKLLELHDRDQLESDIEKRQSRLNPKYLFAIVDLDIQSQSIKNTDYPFSEVEEIYHDLYKNTKVNKTNAKQHRIWVTGLIHKEAYFLLPEFQSLLTEDERIPSPLYKNRTLVLQDLYRDMADAICDDIDIKNYFIRVCDRIKFCSGLDCTEVTKLQESWISEFNVTTKNNGRKRQLILALLKIKKVKPYWKKIKPPDSWPVSEKRYREQLLLNLGRFYATQSQDSEYHFSVFFKTIYDSLIA